MRLSVLGARLHISDVMKCDMHMFVRHSKLCPISIQLNLSASLSEWRHMDSGNQSTRGTALLGIRGFPESGPLAKGSDDANYYRNILGSVKATLGMEMCSGRSMQRLRRGCLLACKR